MSERGAIPQGLDDEDLFKRQLVDLTPDLLGWARYLSKGGDEANDLVHDTIVNALRYRGQFIAGSNLKAWTFRILRNRFLTQRRSSRRTTALDPEMEQRLSVSDDREAAFELDEARRALAAMPEERRRLLLLVGVAGVSYEDLASTAGCALGTIKSRVARARTALKMAVEAGQGACDEQRPHQAADSISREAEAARRLWMSKTAA